MAFATQGQPQIAEWTFGIGSVLALETGGIAPGAVINAPNTFQLRTSIENNGFLSRILVGATGTISYNLTNQATGAVVTLASTPFTVPSGLSFDVDSATFSSGGAGDLDLGNYVASVFITMNAPFNSIVTAFCQSVISVV